MIGILVTITVLLLVVGTIKLALGAFKSRRKLPLEQLIAVTPAPNWKSGHCIFCGSKPGLADSKSQEKYLNLTAKSLLWTGEVVRTIGMFCSTHDPLKLSSGLPSEISSLLREERRLFEERDKGRQKAHGKSDTALSLAGAAVGAMSGGVLSALIGVTAGKLFAWESHRADAYDQFYSGHWDLVFRVNAEVLSVFVNNGRSGELDEKHFDRIFKGISECQAHLSTRLSMLSEIGSDVVSDQIEKTQAASQSLEEYCAWVKEVRSVAETSHEKLHQNRAAEELAVADIAKLRVARSKGLISEREMNAQEQRIKSNLKAAG